jgi:hypothetical protein
MWDVSSPSTRTATATGKTTTTIGSNHCNRNKNNNYNNNHNNYGNDNHDNHDNHLRIYNSTPTGERLRQICRHAA